MTPWRYSVTWDDGRTLEVSIRPGDLARFEAQMGRNMASIMAVDGKGWTSYCDFLLVHKALTRLKVEPEQTLDEFLDTADLDLIQYGEPAGKASGRAASSGRSQNSRRTTASTR